MQAVDLLFERLYQKFAPAPRITGSEWADRYGYLSAESSADPGKWKTIAYQRGILDAMVDPRIERVTVQKSTRVGYTKLLGHAVGFFCHYDPCPIMIVQPTEGDAEQYSKEEIATMIRDTPVLFARISDAKSRDSNNTILQKTFPGGTLSLCGANSPRGFRRVSRRVVGFDEIDGYPESAGSEGDPIELGIKRTEYYWNRKIICGSTPVTEAASRIAPMYLESDQRRRHVPCRSCNKLQSLEPEGFVVPEGKPEDAHFVCKFCGKKMEHKDKFWMDDHGEWIASQPFKGHAGFYIWAAYSRSPNTTWRHIAEEKLKAEKGGTMKLRTFVNTWLGLPYKDKGDAPEWERLFERREKYPISIVPPGGVILTMAADIQKNRIEVEVKAWGKGMQSWSVEKAVLEGDTSQDEVWEKLTAALGKMFPTAAGGSLPIVVLAVDTGYATQRVYNWCRRFPSSRVLPVDGRHELKQTIGVPKYVDVDVDGQRIKNGVRLHPVGSSHIKSEFYGQLRLPVPKDGEDYPPGYCHYPEYDKDWFVQLTSERLVEVKRNGRTVLRWVKDGRNEALDLHVYNRAAAAHLRIDEWTDEHWDQAAAEIRTMTPIAAHPSKSPDLNPNPRPDRASYLRRRRG